MVKKYCAAYPCPNLVGKGKQYCHEHEQAKSNPADKKVTEPFYGTARWKRFRDWYISGHPLCEVCGRPGELVDHIKEIKDGGELLDPDNAKTLCRACHSIKTVEERKKRNEPVVYGY